MQLAQFRQRKAHSDSQNVSKKQKKRKKLSNTKDDELVQESLDIEQSQGEDASLHSCQRGATATSDFAVVRTLHSGEVIKHDQTYTAEVSNWTNMPFNGQYVWVCVSFGTKSLNVLIGWGFFKLHTVQPSIPGEYIVYILLSGIEHCEWKQKQSEDWTVQNRMQSTFNLTPT